MSREFNTHPVLIISDFVMFMITIGTAVAMEKLLFSTALDRTKPEVEDLLLRRSSIRPPFEVK